MDTNQSKLRIFIYGKNALEDIKYICKNIDMNLSIDTKFDGKIYMTKDKEVNYEYFIVSGEISEERSKLIENYLVRDYKEENMANAIEEIKNIVSKNKKKFGFQEFKDIDSDDDSSFGDKYNLYNESISNEITKILSKCRNYYDILIICVDNLLGKDSEAAFKYFQGFTKIFAQQPFIFFLTKKDNNPNITNLFKFVTNEFFDKRNVFAYKFPTNEDEIKIINDHFIKCMNYYHEIGNNFINDKSQTFNILICGKAGVGKSSFINQFLNEKLAKEGEGLSVTQEITNYIHPKYKIKIFDTPGFESDDTVEKVYRTIKKFEKDIRDSRNHLDLIIYFNELSERPLFSLETKLIKHLVKQNKKIIFVMNDKRKTTKKIRARLLDIFKDSIKKIINTMDNIDDAYLKEILQNMVVINLKQYVEEVDDEEENESVKIKIKPSFGMDELFKNIHEMLRPHKISIPDIDKAEDVSQLMKNIKKYNLLNHITNIEDMHINIKIRCANLILSYAKYDWFIWFFRDKRRKELLKEINDINKGDYIDDIDFLFSRIKNKVDNIKDKKEEFIKQFFEGIKKFKGIFLTLGFNFNAYFYNEYTLLIGSEYFKEFQNDYGEYDDKSKKFLKDLCETFNEAIDDFKKLSDEWKEIYSSLKKHKTDKEWVKKFFMVEVPTQID